MTQSSDPSASSVGATKSTWRQQVGVAGTAWRSLSEDLAGVCIDVDATPTIESQRQKPAGAVQER